MGVFGDFEVLGGKFKANVQGECPILGWTPTDFCPCFHTRILKGRFILFRASPILNQDVISTTWSRDELQGRFIYPDGDVYDGRGPQRVAKKAIGFCRLFDRILVLPLGRLVKFGGFAKSKALFGRCWAAIAWDFRFDSFCWATPSLVAILIVPMHARSSTKIRIEGPHVAGPSMFFGTFKMLWDFDVTGNGLRWRKLL